MLSETEKYQLSLYQTQETLKQTGQCVIERVFNTLDEKQYIKRTYQDDRREIFRSISGIACKHIPKIVEIFFDDSTVIIEEFILGNSLTEVVESGSITPKRIAHLSRQLLETLDALHKHNVIHRDVKPDNILVDENDNLCLIDYGIARIHRNDMEKDTQLLGTVGYAPPEQFGFSQSDFRTDLYSVGVTIEEMCRHSNGNPIAVLKVAKKCREFDPNRRYDSAITALHDLTLKKHRQSLILITTTTLVAAAAVFIVTNAVKAPAFPQEDMSSPPVAASTEDYIDSSVPSPEPNGEELISQPLQNSAESIEVEEAAMDEAGWVPILRDYTEREAGASNPQYISFESMQGWGRLGHQMRVSDDLTMSHIEYELNEADLSLWLYEEYTDDDEEKQFFSFKYDPYTDPNLEDYEPFYPTGTVLESEIVLYDLNEDGQTEILVSLCDRNRLNGEDGIIFTQPNWRAVWCVSYNVHEKNWQIDQSFVTFWDTIYVDYIDKRELYFTNTGEYIQMIGENYHLKLDKDWTPSP